MNKKIISKEKQKSKKCVCPEIDKKIKEEVQMFRSKSWRIRTSDGFYNWG
jgi:hypothetical protein